MFWESPTLLNPYEDHDSINDAVAAGEHRQVIGGLWEELGSFQLELLKRFGLAPSSRLLDIGCGSFRGGRHFIEYLNSANYFGLDNNQSLLDAGYAKELMPVGLHTKLPRENLACSGDFEFKSFGESFDRALAFSVFTHIPLNSVRVCLEKLADHIALGGIFHATFFERPMGDRTVDPIRHPPGEVVTQADRDPYHYAVDDFIFAAKGLPWRVEYVGDIGHPRGQKLINFVRVSRPQPILASTGKLEPTFPSAENLGPSADHYRAYEGCNMPFAIARDLGKYDGR